MIKKLFLLSVCLVSFASVAKEPPINITADSITFDHNTGRVKADGGVEATQGLSIMSAPHLEYDTKRSELIAWGGVTVKRPNEKFSLDSVVVGKNMANINAENLSVDMGDGASIRATKIKGTDSGIVFEDISYTACKRDPSCSLTWEIRANELKRDGETVQYYSAWLEMWGLPIFYMPYLSHPDPSIKHKSGFLFPSFGTSSELGAYIETPYHIAISNSESLILKPKFTSDEGINWGGEHEKKFSFGEIKTTGSYTNEDSIGHDRGHVFSYSKFNLDDVWRAYGNIEYATDDTYLRKYDISREAYLHNDVGIEGLSNRSYFALKLHKFQDMRSDVDDDLVPEVFPMVHFNRVFEPNSFGAYWNVKFDSSSLKYPTEEEQHKGSLNIAWTLPYITSYGLKLETKLSTRGDMYHYKNVTLPTDPDYTGTTTRILPQGSVKAEMPFIKVSENSTQILTPTMQLVSSANDNFNDEILNTDSTGTIFDDSNVFEENRYIGLDRAETGTRINYGINWSSFGNDFGKINAFVGQTFRLNSIDEFPENSGLESELSDYVGRLMFNPTKWLDAIYRFRMDKDTFEFERNELTLKAGSDINYVYLDYVYDQKNNETGIDDSASEEGYIQGSIGLTNHFGIYVMDRYNFSNSSQTMVGGGLQYTDDCFNMKIGYRKEYAKDRDYQGEEKIYINFIFKTLGGVGE